MAISYVRQQGAAQAATSSTTIAVNLGANLVAGNTIVVVVSTGGTPVFQSIGAVTGITWGTVAAGANAASNSSIGAVIGTCTAQVNSGTTITATLSAADTRRTITIEEFTGVDLVSPQLANAQASGAAGTDATPTTGAITGANIALVTGNAMNGTGLTMNPPSSPAGFVKTLDVDNTSKHITVAYVLGQSSGTFAEAHTVATGTRAAAEGLVVALLGATVTAVPSRRFFFASKARKPVAPRNRNRIAWR